VLKTGCKVERLRLQSGERLMRAITLQAWVASRVVQLRDAAKQKPQASCRECFSDDEWQTLWAREHQRAWRAEEGEPTVQEVVKWLGQLGGHLGRNRDGLPGAEVLSRALYALTLLLEGRAIGRAEAAGPPSAGRPPPTEAETATPACANFVAAARRAARAMASERRGTPAAAWFDKPQHTWRNFHITMLLGAWRPPIKYVVLGISVIVLMCGVVCVALDLFRNTEVAESARSVTRLEDAARLGGEAIPLAPESPDQPLIRSDANLEAPMLPASANANAIVDESMLGRGAVASALIRDPLLQVPASRDAVSQSVAASSAPARDLAEMPLPLTIGGKALIVAATAGEPGASYEVAVRFAQGRHAPQDFAMAAAWFERAARAGIAPAQFRLGSMYEKGLGVKKDLAEARRLYLAAADKGNAKAMHNLAVLYANGLDGKPDYAVASQWFRGAAAHGIGDSQYNLAILYARGLGVERNTAESYKWFALAARGGDKDATRKRDDIAARLDPKQLESAKLKVESFVAEPQPDEATTTRAPAGGWDQIAAAPTTKSKFVR